MHQTPHLIKLVEPNFSYYSHGGVISINHIYFQPHSETMFPLEIHLVKNERNRIKGEKYGITFNSEETLKTVWDERGATIKIVTSIRKEHAALVEKKRKELHSQARTIGGRLRSITFDHDSATWMAKVYKGVGRNTTFLTITIPVLTNERHRSLNENLPLSDKKESRLNIKWSIIFDAYKEELTKMLFNSGIQVATPKELFIALSKSNWDLEEAFSYAMHHIYTPLKMIMIELLMIRSEVKGLRRDMKLLCTEKANDDLVRREQDTMCEMEEQKNEMNHQIKMLIERNSELRKEVFHLKSTLMSRLVEACVHNIERDVVMYRLRKNHWNLDETMDQIIQKEMASITD